MRSREASLPCTRRSFIGTASCTVCGLLLGLSREPAFMRYDEAARRVDLRIIAAFDRSNSGFNLNGGSHGEHRITVPTGWEVRLAFVNGDIIPHSVVVIREEEPLPLRVPRPALPGAASRALLRGLPAGARQDDVVFVARPPGAYLIACGVPGHAALGGYLRLTVSSVARLPTYDVTPESG